MIVIMVLVLLAFVVMLFGSHWLIYFSLVKIFHIQNQNLKISLGAVLVFLSLSFILASLLAHWKENEATRIFYLFSSVWLAFLNNFALVFIAAWLFKWGLKIIHWELDLKKMAILLILIAVFTTVYGIWNAFNPRIKNITVKIKNLPANWQGKTAVQISDVHLGHVYRQKFLQKVVALTNSAKPDIIFITGDLFDGMDGELANLAAPLNGLQAENVFMVNGNHENYLGVDRAKKALEETPKIKLLENQMVDIQGLKVIGLNYPNEREHEVNFSEIIKNLNGYNSEAANVLLYHEPRDIQEAKDLGIKLQLAGHTHKGQSIPFNLITHWFFKGFDYGLFKLGDYNLYVTSGVGTWGPPMRTGNCPEIVVIKFE